MKRIISSLVLLTLLFTLCVPTVIAENEADITATEDFSLLEALKIDKDVNTNLSDLITRAEFTAMAVRCLNGRYPSSYDGSFTDVKEGDLFAEEIYAAKVLKMTNGTAPGVFSPQESVTSNVALKIIITAMGYEELAVAKGGYPAGYMAIENKLRLLKGSEIRGELTVLDAKRIITNALKAKKALLSAVENDMIIYDTDDDRCLLTENFNLTKIEGIVSGADYLTLADTVPDENYVTVANRTFKSRVSSAQYFGMKVTAYYSSENGEIYAIEKDKINKEVTVCARDVLDYKNKTLTVKKDGRNSSYKTDGGLSFIKNGRLIAHTDADFKFSDGFLKLIDNDGDGIYEFVLAEKIEYYVISGINYVTQTIYDMNSPIGPICFDKEELPHGKRCALVNLGGGEFEFDALKEGDVLCIMQSNDKKVLTVRAGGSKVFSGTLDAITEDGYEIDGIEYLANGYFTARKIKLTLGKKYDFSVASDGSITSAKESGAGSIKYGYLINVGRSGSLSSKTEVKILDEMGNIRIFSLAKKLMLDGEKNIAHNDAKIDSALKNSGYPKYQLLRYDTNNEGEISLLDTYSDAADTLWKLPENVDERNSLRQYLSKTSVEYRSASTFGAPYFSFARGVIFAVPKELKDTPLASYDEELFTVYDVSALSNAKDYYADIFDFDENYYPKAITLYTESATSDSGKVSGGADSHMVYKVKNGIDGEGNDTVILYTYSNGIYYQNYIQSSKLAGITGEGNLPAPGDVIRMAFNKKGEVSGILIDVKYNSSTKKGEVKYTTGSATSALSFISGTVKTVGEGIVTLNAETLPKNTTLINNVAPLANDAGQYVIYNTSDGTVTKGLITDLIGEKSGNASKVVCRLSYYEIADIFIYVD